MKRILTILLAALFLFNLVGYRLVFNYMQHQADIQMEVSLNKQDYNENELVTIKVPLSLPYMNDQQNFERVNGEITVNGKILKYVKRKISGGNLILICLPDDNKMRIVSAKTEFFKYANDMVSNSPTKKSGNTKSSVFKNMLGEYDVIAYHYADFYRVFIHTYQGGKDLNILPFVHLDLPDQPPQLI